MAEEVGRTVRVAVFTHCVMPYEAIAHITRAPLSCATVGFQVAITSSVRRPTTLFLNCNPWQMPVSLGVQEMELRLYASSQL